MAVIPLECYEESIPTAGYRGRGFASAVGERKKIIDMASETDIMNIELKLYEEEKVLRCIREKVLERKLPMVILDAEFQYDRHKLTFYFESSRRIDFRDLVSELFSQYKTRIWMQQVDCTDLPPEDDPGNQLATAAGFLPDANDSADLR